MACGKAQNSSQDHLSKRYNNDVRTLIIGCGYTGKALGEELISLGHEVVGIQRDEKNNKQLIQRGIIPINIDITKNKEISRIPNKFDNVIISVSSSRGGIEAYEKIFITGITNVSSWLKTQSINSVVFISSTSVYRQTNAEWVDEKNSIPLSSTNSNTLFQSEQIISNTQTPVTILRSSGIYGPQRGYLFNQYMNGNAKIEGKGERFLNMVHRSDLVNAIIKSLPDPGGIFNISDDEPVTQYDFFKWLSDKTGRPMPPSIPTPDPSTRKRGITNKKVSNKLFKKHFGFEYKYPTFREGFIEELRKST